MQRFAIVISTLLLMSPMAYALEGSFHFVSLGFGRGWEPYSCFEQGTVPTFGQAVRDDVYTYPPSCPNVQSCPFEDAAFDGEVECNSVANLKAPSGLILDVNVAEDIKLVTSDGYAISMATETTDVCEEESVDVEKGTNNGEWWGKGGVNDSPPVYWVDDVVEFVKKVVQYHKTAKTNMANIATTENFPSGYVDPIFGVPVYPYRPAGTVYQKPVTIYGNLVCSASSNLPTGKLQAGQQVNVNSKYLCTFYFFSIQNRDDPSKANLVIRQPSVIQARSDSIFDFRVHNIKYKTIEDLFNVGESSLQTKLRVVEPTQAKPIISAIKSTGAADGIVKITIGNDGKAPMKIDGLEIDGSKPIYCDSKAVSAGQKAECLAHINKDSAVNLMYTQTSCGKPEQLSISMFYNAATGQLSDKKPQASTETAKETTPKETYICSSNSQCTSGVCCAGLCRTAGEGTCEDIDGNGEADTWVPN